MTQALLDFTPILTPTAPVQTPQPIKLPKHLQVVYDALKGTWRTEYEVQMYYKFATGKLISASNAGRRIRDLRAWGIEIATRRHANSRAWEYRV